MESSIAAMSEAQLADQLLRLAHRYDLTDEEELVTVEITRRLVPGLEAVAS